MASVVQVIGDNNSIVTQIRDKFEIGKTNINKQKKNKLLKYCSRCDTVDSYKHFHEEDADSQMYSIVLSRGFIRATAIN